MDQRKQTAALWRSVCLIALSYFLIECLGALLTGAKDPMVLIFGGLWTVLLTALVTALPRLAGRILYGISYYFPFFSHKNSAARNAYVIALNPILFTKLLIHLCHP